MSFSADTGSNCVKPAQESKTEGVSVVKTTSPCEETLISELSPTTLFKKITLDTMFAEDLSSYPRRPLERGSLWCNRTSSRREGVSGKHRSVDVWIAPKSVQKDMRRHVSSLNDRERRRACRMRHLARRAGYEQGRILLRGALSHRVQGRVLPADWAFLDDDGKKPVVNNKLAAPHFSISHTDVADIVVVSDGGPIGFDAENIFSKSNEIIAPALSVQEGRKISKLQKNQQWPAFVRLWTFKEAFTKLLGVGVDVDFSKIEFDLDSSRLISAPRNIKRQQSVVFESFVIQIDGNPVRMTIAVGAKQAEGSFDELSIRFVTNATKSIEKPAPKIHPIVQQSPWRFLGGLRHGSRL